MIMEVKDYELIVLTRDGEFRSVPKRKIGYVIGEEIDLPPSYEVVCVADQVKPTSNNAAQDSERVQTIRVVKNNSPNDKHSEVTKATKDDEVSSNEQEKRKKWSMPYIVMAASILLLVIASLGYLGFSPDNTAIAYVHIDVNPSVEIAINKSLQVVEISALNQDGDLIVNNIQNWSYQSLDAVTLSVLRAANQQGYDTRDADILISTSFINNEHESKYLDSVYQALQQMEAQMVKDQLSENTVRASESEVSNSSSESHAINISTQSESSSNNEHNVETVKIHKVSANREVREEAKQLGISPGKYIIYLRAQEQGIEVDLEQITRSSVSEIARNIGGIGQLLNPTNVQRNGKSDDTEEEDQSNRSNGNSGNRDIDEKPGNRHGQSKDKSEEEDDEAEENDVQQASEEKGASNQGQGHGRGNGQGKGQGQGDGKGQGGNNGNGQGNGQNRDNQGDTRFIPPGLRNSIDNPTDQLLKQLPPRTQKLSDKQLPQRPDKKNGNNK